MARMSVEERRTALVESAYRVIADHGVEGATTRRICAQAGMPLASFHYAFESRIALLCAVMEQAVPLDIYSILMSLMPEVTEPKTRGLEVMRANMKGQFNTFHQLLKADPGRMQATISLGIYAHNHPELQQVGKQMYHRLYELAALGLTAAAEETGTRWTRTPRELGPLVIAATNAITLTHLSTSDDDVIAVLIDALVRELMAYVAED